jgi:hypothetical protein
MHDKVLANAVAAAAAVCTWSMHPVLPPPVSLPAVEQVEDVLLCHESLSW